MTGAKVTVPAEFGQSLALTAVLDGRVQVITSDHGEVESVVSVDSRDLLRAVELVTE